MPGKKPQGVLFVQTEECLSLLLHRFLFARRPVLHSETKKAIKLRRTNFTHMITHAIGTIAPQQ